MIEILDPSLLISIIPAKGLRLVQLPPLAAPPGRRPQGVVELYLKAHPGTTEHERKRLCVLREAVAGGAHVHGAERTASCRSASWCRCGYQSSKDGRRRRQGEQDSQATEHE
jgi:hypothetical protein